MQPVLIKPVGQQHGILNFFAKKGEPTPKPPRACVTPNKKKARKTPTPPKKTRVKRVVGRPPTKSSDASEKIAKLTSQLRSKHAHGDLNVRAEKYKKWNGTVCGRMH